MTSGLNHAAHIGVFGEGFAVSLVTGRARHILMPDLISGFGSADYAAGPGAHAQKSGVALLRGKESGFYVLDESGYHVGVDLGVSAGVESFYYSGSVRTLTLNTFTGNGWQAGGAFLSVGMSVSYASVDSGRNFVLGFGASLGAGPAGQNMEAQ